MSNFWDFSVWNGFNIVAVLLISLLAASILKKTFKFLRVSLIPVSVLGGGILILVEAIYKWITGDQMFESAFFGANGTEVLEIITYHALALGFVAQTFKSTDAKMSKQRTTEIFNTGVTTVSTYLLQGVVGLGITIVAAVFISDFFAAAGILLPFGYGQGTGQALNYGGIYQTDFGFVGGRSFGLTIAALGFLSASIGGVIHLNILRKKGKLKEQVFENKGEVVGSEENGSMTESIDKMTIQIALIALAYLIAYLLMSLLGKLLPSMKSVIFGFNFLLGVVSATLVKTVMKFLNKKKLIRRKHINNFLMTRLSNFCFDVMVVAGIAAIRLDELEKYWGVMLILGGVGLVVTYVYNYFVAKTLFKDYPEEQFLTMYGMLTGTASTGIILLREIDGDFKTPAADNLVYQNFPAIVFGFPIMLLATLAPVKPILTLILLAVFFVVMNIILFRSKIFKKRKK